MSGMGQRLKAGSQWPGNPYRKERSYWITGVKSRQIHLGWQAEQGLQERLTSIVPLTCLSVFSLQERLTSHYHLHECRDQTPNHIEESANTLVVRFYAERNTCRCSRRTPCVYQLSHSIHFFTVLSVCFTEVFPWNSLIFTAPDCNTKSLKTTFLSSFFPLLFFFSWVTFDI